MVCPWNRFASDTEEPDFRVRNRLDSALLVEVFGWSEQEFLNKTEGSAIRRLNYEMWSRNVATALGNANSTSEVVRALNSRKNDQSALVREHVEWALRQHNSRRK